MSETNKLAQATMYELNQGILNQFPPMDAAKREKAYEDFKSWIEKHKIYKYFMLLCNELNYYTVFHINEDEMPTRRFWVELLDMENYIGNFKSMDVDNNNCYAIWADWNNEGLVHCFYLFPYDKGIVEVEY